MKLGKFVEICSYNEISCKMFNEVHDDKDGDFEQIIYDSLGIGMLNRIVKYYEMALTLHE